MNTKLNHVQDWQELAKQANWSVSRMAKLCNVSSRTLQRHFLKERQKTPKSWLVDERQKQAIAFLCAGTSVKVTAFRLGYKQPHHFSREFKLYWGVCPSDQRVSNKLAEGARCVLV